MNYSGAEWMEDQLKYYASRKGVAKGMSNLGARVANLLGELFLGLYHIDTKALLSANWDNTHFVEIRLKNVSMSTFDGDKLTRLVLLAHHCALRVDIDACAKNTLMLMFHPRDRSGDMMKRHPTVAEAVARFDENVSLPEWK